MRERLTGFLAAARLSDRHRDGGAASPRWTGRPRAWRGHPVRPGPHLPPDRAVPAGNVERRVPGLVFAGSGTVPGRRRADGAGQRQARGRAGAGVRRRRPARVPRTVVRSSAATPVDVAGGARRGLARCARITREHGTTYYWGARLLPAGTPPPRLRALRPLPARRRHRRRSPAPATPARETALAARRLRRRVLGRPGHRRPRRRPGDGRHRRLGARVRHRRTSASTVLRRDGEGPHADAPTRRGTTCSATWTARPPSSAR